MTSPQVYDAATAPKAWRSPQSLYFGELLNDRIQYKQPKTCIRVPLDESLEPPHGKIHSVCLPAGNRAKNPIYKGIEGQSWSWPISQSQDLELCRQTYSGTKRKGWSYNDDPRRQHRDYRESNWSCPKGLRHRLWWRSPAERRAVLQKRADTLNEDKEEFAKILCMQNGKPYQDALMFDCTFLVKSFQYFGSLNCLRSSMIRVMSMLRWSMSHLECGGILPINWPPLHTGGRLAPSLATGNTTILKPGEQAPLTVLRICEVLETVLPKDV